MQLTELHTYLALAGNQRLPHLEEEIFADEAATTIYLHNLCREELWYDQDDSNAYLGFYCANDILESRWPLAEPYIMKDPKYALYYAVVIMNSCWPEAEPTIKTDPVWWNEYICRFRIDGYKSYPSNITNLRKI